MESMEPIMIDGNKPGEIYQVGEQIRKHTAFETIYRCKDCGWISGYGPQRLCPQCGVALTNGKYRSDKGYKETSSLRKLIGRWVCVFQERKAKGKK